MPQCSALQRGHNYKSFPSGTYKGCNYIPYPRVQNDRYCVCPQHRNRQTHTWKFPRRRHGRSAYLSGAPAALPFSGRHSFATDGFVPGIFCPGSFLWSQGVQTQYSPHCIRPQDQSVPLLSEWITAGLLPLPSGRHTGFSFLPADTSVSG